MKSQCIGIDSNTGACVHLLDSVVCFSLFKHEQTHADCGCNTQQFLSGKRTHSTVGEYVL